jgi:hypothetical protein
LWVLSPVENYFRIARDSGAINDFNKRTVEVGGTASSNESPKSSLCE